MAELTHLAMLTQQAKLYLKDDTGKVLQEVAARIYCRPGWTVYYGRVRGLSSTSVATCVECLAYGDTSEDLKLFPKEMFRRCLFTIRSGKSFTGHGGGRA